MSAMKKRSVVIDGQRTSISMEDEFWNQLKLAAGRRRKKLNELVTDCSTKRDLHAPEQGLSSYLRVFVLQEFTGV